MKRDKRLEIIKEIVTNNKISTQEELQSLLLERGVEASYFIKRYQKIKYYKKTG